MPAFAGSIEEVAAQAERILITIVPGAHCVAQEYDNRIDCVLRLADNSVVGEMILLPDVTEKRIQETAERLKQRKLGINVPLVNELWPPIRISRS